MLLKLLLGCLHVYKKVVLGLDFNCFLVALQAELTAKLTRIILKVGMFDHLQASPAIFIIRQILKILQSLGRNRCLDPLDRFFVPDLFKLFLGVKTLFFLQGRGRLFFGVKVKDSFQGFNHNLLLLFLQLLLLEYLRLQAFVRQRNIFLPLFSAFYNILNIQFRWLYFFRTCEQQFFARI